MEPARSSISPFVAQQPAQERPPVAVAVALADPQVTPSVPAAPPQPATVKSLEKTQVCTFLKMTGLIRENRYEWTLEEVITEKVFSILKEIEKPSQEQLTAFFFLLFMLNEKTHNTDLLKKDLLLLTGKEKLESPIAALCIVANCRHFFSTPLGALLDEKFPSSREKSKEMSLLFFSCFSYLEQFSQNMMNELKRFRSEREEAIQKMKDLSLAQLQKKTKQKIDRNATRKRLHVPSEESLFKSIKVLEIHSKKVTGILATITFDSYTKSNLPLQQMSLYQQFLYHQSNIVVNSLEECRKLAEEVIESKNKGFSIKIDALEDANPRSKKAEETQAPMNEGTKVVVKEIAEMIARGKTDFFSNDLPTAKKIEEEDWAKLPLNEHNLGMSELQFAKNSYARMKQKMLFLRDTRQKMFSLALDKLQKLKTDLPSKEEDTSWLFLEDLENDFEEVRTITKQKKSQPIAPASKPEKPWEIWQSTLTETVGVTHVIPLFSHLLSKEVKRFLMRGATQAKAQVALDELRDHMHYAALNFTLFIKMMLEGDLYGLNTVLPMLFLDLHVQTEQWIKHGIILKTGDYPPTHSLLALAREASLEENSFFNDFNHALIQARYPIASRDYYRTPPKALEWILFSLSLGDAYSLDTEMVEKLQSLIVFVFDSYRQSIELLAKPLKIDGQIALMRNYLEDTKKQVQEKIKSLQGKPLKECKKGEAIAAILERASQLKKVETTEAISQVLHEASAHLTQLAAAHYLRMHFSDKIFTPLHQRHQLLYNWVFEQLFVCQGLARGIGDLRWIRHHDLSAYYYIVHPEDFAPHDARLDPFNFGRTLHYGREKSEDQAPDLIKNLLQTLKSSKKLVKQQLLKTPKVEAAKKSKSPDLRAPIHPERIEREAAELLQAFVKDTLFYISTTSLS